MPRPHRESNINTRSYRPPEFARLSDFQLQELNEELKSYINEKGVLDDTAWLKYKGALNKNGAVIIEGYVAPVYVGDVMKSPCDCFPILYEQLKEDLAQWYFWKAGKEYGEKKRLEQLDEIR